MNNLPLRVHFSIFLFSLLITPLFSLAGIPVKHAISNTISTAAGRHVNNFSPLDVTESLAANLYLLQPDNSLILADGFYAQYNDAYHDSVTMEDALKLTNILENIGLLRYNKTLAVERRPIIKANDTLFIKLWKTTCRSYQLEMVTNFLSNIGLQAFFVDSYLNTKTPLSLASTIKINFTVNTDAASAAKDRFKIIFKPAPSFAPLPVTFSAETAIRQGGNVAVKWTVENEINMAGYEVEKSPDAKAFTSVAVKLVSGTNNASGNYSWTDENPSMATVFYRIKSIGTNGSYKYAPVIQVAASQTVGSFSVYPNPVKGNDITVQIQNQLAGTYQVRLINMQGQVAFKNTISLNSSNMSQTISMGKQQPKGIYQLEITGADNIRRMTKLVVQ